jgi:DNA-binding transcriptional ArsR family regulator
MSEELSDTLAGIEITPEGKKPQKELELVADEQRTGVLSEPVRRQIIGVLRNGIDDEITTEEFNKETNERIIRKRDVKRYAMSVVEIVKASTKDAESEGFTKNQVYHHLPALIEAGLVIKYGTVTTGKRTTDYYRRTAKGFIITRPIGQNEKEMRKELVEKCERMLKVFHLDVPEDRRDEFIDLCFKADTLSTSWRTKLGELIREDVTDPEILDMYTWLMNIYALGSTEYMEYAKKIRKILFPKE